MLRFSAALVHFHLHQIETLEHFFEIARTIQKDFDLLQFIDLVPRVKAILASGSKTMNLNTPDRGGYTHTYQEMEGSVAGPLLWWQPHEATKINGEAQQDAAHLLGAIGIQCDAYILSDLPKRLAGPGNHDIDIHENVPVPQPKDVDLATQAQLGQQPDDDGIQQTRDILSLLYDNTPSVPRHLRRGYREDLFAALVTNDVFCHGLHERM